MRCSSRLRGRSFVEYRSMGYTGKGNNCPIEYQCYRQFPHDPMVRAIAGTRNRMTNNTCNCEASAQRSLLVQNPLGNTHSRLTDPCRRTASRLNRCETRQYPTRKSFNLRLNNGEWGMRNVGLAWKYAASTTRSSHNILLRPGLIPRDFEGRRWATRDYTQAWHRAQAPW